MYRGRVDSDAEALMNRIEVNSRAKYNLESFIDSKLALAGTERLLDLNCGTGKQIRYFRQAYPTLDITGCDIAPAMLENVSEANVICADMDTVLFDKSFDVVLSVYGFYYSKDMVSLGRKIAGWLKPGGRLFLVGPGRGTNKELIDLANEVQPGSMYHTKDFISDEQIADIGYSKVETCRLENEIAFNSKDEVLRWWRNHNSFIPELLPLVEPLLPDRFKLSKNTFGVMFYV